MAMSSKRLPKSMTEERYFRWRGGDVSRIESLSDAIFAFSLTLQPATSVGSRKTPGS